MPNTRFASIVVSLPALAAILALSVLPPAHLHASDGSNALVHRHAIEHDVAHGGAALDHDGHSTVQTLEPTFTSQRQYEVDRPATSPGPVVVTPDRRSAGRVHRIDPPRTHGPPIRIRSLRAPPA